MNKTEVKILQNTMWLISVAVGYATAKTIYNKGCITYVKVFHNKLYRDIINNMPKS